MNFEAGKHYTTREKFKAYIGYQHDGRWYGHILGHDGAVSCSWACDGVAELRIIQYDIVGPWRDPPKEIWVNEYSDGMLVAHRTEEAACSEVSRDATCIAVHYREIQE